MELPSSLGMGRAIARRGGGELGCVEGWILRKSSGKLCLIKRWIKIFVLSFFVVQVKCNETSILDFEQFDGNKTCWVNF